MAKKQLVASAAILGEEEASTRVETRGRKKLDPNELKSAQISLMLRPTTKENLKELAWRNRISTNELINQIVEEYLRENFKG